MILFHGAKEEIVEKVSVRFSKSNNDFGKGFYLGESFINAASFISTYNMPSIYIYKLKNFKKLRTKRYDVTKEWMILIAYFRGKLSKYKDNIYLKNLIDDLKEIDLIIAPIADNTMYSILDRFIDGEITDEQCLYSLSANRLGKQYVLLNDRVIDNHLVLLEKCYVCQKEREDVLSRREEEYNIGQEKVKVAMRKYAGKGKYIEELLENGFVD